MISIEKNSFCRVLVNESINTNFGSNDIIYTDYCCLLRCEKDSYESQAEFWKTVDNWSNLVDILIEFKLNSNWSKIIDY